MYRLKGGELQVFLVHMGGPFWAKKDEGAWSIPKGEFSDDEEALSAACREFFEETGFPPDGNFIPLSAIKQSGGKVIYSWAMEGDADPSLIKSNMFELEWPPRSGKMKLFPEVDRAAWFPLEQARVKILKGQQPLLDELITVMKYRTK